MDLKYYKLCPECEECPEALAKARRQPAKEHGGHSECLGCRAWIRACPADEALEEDFS